MSLTKATFSMIYGGEVNVRDFGADPTGTVDSSAAIQAAIDYAVSSNIRQVNLGYGIFKISITINFHTRGISFVGVVDSSTQTGSVFAGCTILWDGGASPMFASTSSYNYYTGFGVENRGSATDWLQLNAGCIGDTYDKLYFIDTVTNTRLSRSVIYSNGARFGYSRFSQLQIDSFAPVFLYAVGTGDASTPIQIDNRCIVRPTTADMTFIKFENVKCEGITIDNCTFIQAGYQCLIFDSNTSPATDILDYFTFSNSEIDADTADNAAWRFFKFTNIHNIAFTQSTFNCGGLKDYVADLVNSDVSEFYGNAYKSLNSAFFNADATSFINQGQITSYGPYVQVPVFTAASAGLNAPTYGTLMDIDGRKLNPSKHEILVIDVTDNVAHTIAIDTTGIQFMTSGQVFTVNIKNVSGGAMGATTFFTGDFSTTGATVAPANGFNRSYTFYWNGSKAYEISRSAADVVN